ncbi:Transcriptional regulator, RpiR family protein [Geobacillus sp. WSUCF1]|nr:Transcriptional regulator, RpiR family protein [Geobacillus sp. WSUCF1]
MTTKDLAQAADTSEASVVCFASFVATEEKSSWPDDGKHLTCFARGQHHDLEGWRLNRKRSVVPRFKLRTFYKTSLFFAFAQPPAYI